jgi:hypothetical protein
MKNPFRLLRREKLDDGETLEGWAQNVLKKTAVGEFRRFLESPEQDHIDDMVHTTRDAIYAVAEIIEEIERELPPAQVVASTMAVANYEDQMRELEPFLQLIHDLRPGVRRDPAVMTVLSMVVLNRNIAHSVIAKIQALLAFPGQDATRIAALQKRYTNEDIAHRIAKMLNIDKK